MTTESDVEQKLALLILTDPRPQGLGIPSAEIFTKPDIRDFQIGKGTKSKLYYPDYIVTRSTFPVVVVEVKRPSESLAEAASECRLYATELNAQYPPDINPCKYCIVTNGSVVELRATDSETILVCFTLEDVRSISPNFAKFLEILGEQSLSRHINKIKDLIPKRRYYRALNLIGGITVRNEEIPYNNFGRELAANFEGIFEPTTIEDRERIVNNAYVSSRRRHRYADEIQRIIRNSALPEGGSSTLIENSANPIEITGRFSNPQLLKNKILLLIGTVGSGKSTFIDHLQKVVLPPELKEQTLWLRIDLNPAPVNSSDIYNWVRKQIIEGLHRHSVDVDLDELETLKKIYRWEISQFTKGEGALLRGDSKEFNSRLATLISGLKNNDEVTIHRLQEFLCGGTQKLLVIVLDNCDKRNRDEQLLMFQVAKYIQQQIKCLVILPLRNSTFNNHRHEPPLDTALKDLVYRIEPPPFQEVLTKRIGLVVAEARSHGHKSITYHSGNATVTFQVDNLERFLHAMKDAVFNNAHFGASVITNLAGRNIRKAFEIFLEFCRSGYIRDSDIFERQVETTHYRNLHHNVVAKVLMRTNRRYYDGDESFIKNLFQCDPNAVNPTPFVRYWILEWLERRMEEMGPGGIKGYHRHGDLIRDLLIRGIDPNVIRTEIYYLAKAECIVFEHLRLEPLAHEDLLTITSSGLVHLKIARTDIYYFACCAEDSYTSSLELAEQVRSRIVVNPFWKGQSWDVTIELAEAFAKYLEGERNRSGTEIPFLSIGASGEAATGFETIFSHIATNRSRLAERRRD